MFFIIRSKLKSEFQSLIVTKYMYIRPKTSESMNLICLFPVFSVIVTVLATLNPHN